MRWPFRMLATPKFVERSLRALAAVLPLVGADLRRRRSSEVLASNACDSGIAVCVAFREHGPLTKRHQTCCKTFAPFGHSVGAAPVISCDAAKGSQSLIQKRWASQEMIRGGVPCLSDEFGSKKRAPLQRRKEGRAPFQLCVQPHENLEELVTFTAALSFEKFRARPLDLLQLCRSLPPSSLSVVLITIRAPSC